MAKRLKDCSSLHREASEFPVEPENKAKTEQQNEPAETHQDSLGKTPNSPSAPTVIANGLGMGKMYSFIKLNFGRAAAIIVVALVLLVSSVGSFAMWLNKGLSNRTN